MDARTEDRLTPEVEVHPTAVVEEGARIGERCVLGKSVFVDSGTVIASGCHIQNSVSVYSGVIFEEDVFVGPAAVFTNDRFLRRLGAPADARPPWHLDRSQRDDPARVTIGGCAVVAAGGVVTKDVEPHRLVVG